MIDRAEVLDRFGAVVDGVTDWDAPTPVAEWRARDVVGHLTTWLPGFLQGAGFPLDTPPDDVPPPAAWAQHRAAVERLLAQHGDEPLQHPMTPGDGTLAEGVDRFYTADVFMHTWDLARASGQDPRLDEQSASELLSGLRAAGPALHESGQFGRPRDVPEDAPVTDRLMAFIGRDPRLALSPRAARYGLNPIDLRSCASRSWPARLSAATSSVSWRPRSDSLSSTSLPSAIAARRWIRSATASKVGVPPAV
ncbi:TIGR03086 family metal-binding protein [Cumulibacter manganitolerans]|uniref:TIGR03086 family metal-binding protein n=1 Tax=Cumulibacter manganitolerans TaxID=1884992 RepID=UPI001E4A2960|nr:TIGR03086 family metal-binding protein [Cumulibacter manganitolerans]